MAQGGFAGPGPDDPENLFPVPNRMPACASRPIRVYNAVEQFRDLRNETRQADDLVQCREGGGTRLGRHRKRQSVLQKLFSITTPAAAERLLLRLRSKV